MAYCSKCGAEVQSNFCPNCGNSIQGEITNCIEKTYQVGEWEYTKNDLLHFDKKRLNEIAKLERSLKSLKIMNIIITSVAILFTLALLLFIWIIYAIYYFAYYKNKRDEIEMEIDKLKSYNAYDFMLEELKRLKREENFMQGIKAFNNVMKVGNIINKF